MSRIQAERNDVQLHARPSSTVNTQFGWHGSDGRVAMSVECHSSGGQRYKQV